VFFPTESIDMCVFIMLAQALLSGPLASPVTFRKVRAVEVCVCVCACVCVCVCVCL
jgi:hypothetical protein